MLSLNLNALNRRVFLSGFAAAVAVPAVAAAQQTASLPAAAGNSQLQGKLATKTEVVISRNEAAMVSQSSDEAMQAAIAMYDEIVAQGGWPQLANTKYEKDTKSRNVLRLRERLVREGYLGLESLGSAAPDQFDEELAKALRSFQYNHGIYRSGKVDKNEARKRVLISQF